MTLLFFAHYWLKKSFRRNGMLVEKRINGKQPFRRNGMWLLTRCVDDVFYQHSVPFGTVFIDDCFLLPSLRGRSPKQSRKVVFIHYNSFFFILWIASVVPPSQWRFCFLSELWFFWFKWFLWFFLLSCSSLRGRSPKQSREEWKGVELLVCLFFCLNCDFFDLNDLFVFYSSLRGAKRRSNPEDNLTGFPKPYSNTFTLVALNNFLLFNLIFDH